MFPFTSRWRWHLAHPTVHLVEATHNHLDSLKEPYQGIARARARLLPPILRTRLILILLLSPAVLAAILTAIARVLPAFEDLVDVLNWILSLAGTLALVVLLLFFLVNRLLGQLEKDLIACLALGTIQSINPSPAAKSAKKTTKRKS